MKPSRTTRLTCLLSLAVLTCIIWGCTCIPFPITQGGQICIYIPPYFEFKDPDRLTKFLEKLDSSTAAKPFFKIIVHRKGMPDKTYGSLTEVCCEPVPPKRGGRHYRSSVEVTQKVNSMPSRGDPADKELSEIISLLR